ncbi:MAG: MFS transporter [Firmicutes bacterium]|nr:MFS transporter [Bacillota bacterium]
MPEERGKVLAILRNKNYLLLWSGQLISSIGTSFNAISLYFLLLKSSELGGILPLFGLFFLNALVYLVFAPFTGALVDTWNRRRTMIAADLVRAGLVMLIPFTTSLWQIYALNFFISLFTLFFDPARNSLLPRVLEERKDLLFIGNSFMTSSTSIAETIGFLTGGMFIVAFGYAAAFYLDSLTFVLSAICVLLLKVKEPEAEPGVEVAQVVESFWRKIREGVKLVLAEGKLRSLFSYYFLFALGFGAGNFLFPILIEEGYQLGADAFGFFSGTMTFGYLVGSFIIGPLGDRLNRYKLFLAAVLLIGLSTVLLGSVASLGWAIPWAFLIGFLNPVTLVFSRVFIQEEVAEGKLGRVFSLFSLVMQVGLMASLGISLGLLQVLPIRSVMVALGLSTTLVALVGPSLTRFGKYAGRLDEAEGTEVSASG